ncbi:MAG: hypothetical protein M3Y28_02820 [Armatimonadota bacterium]|nr:hypothetical protein [Armatimonadota bacterium]
MLSVNRWGVALTLAVAGWASQPSLAADPAATLPTPATPPTPAAMTPQETALKAHFDPLQTQLAAAVTAKKYDDYKSALNKLATPDCKFYDVSGKSTSHSQFLDDERQALAAQGPGLTETMRAQTLHITGSTALETAVVTDDTDTVDTAGQYGAKGKKHHWERQTSLRLHLAKAKTAKANDASAWKATEIAVTDIRTLLDGQPYVPPQPKTKPPSSTKKQKNNTRQNRNRTQQPYYRMPKNRSSRVRRTPYVIHGVRVY